MSEIQEIKLSDIHVPERLREVNEEAANIISASIVEHGQLQPITVRKTPNGKAKFSLVFGATRYRSVELCKGETIECIIVKADADEAILLEVAENLFRDDLTSMDRAIFVQTYRDMWEQKNGEINSKGGRPKNSDKLAPFPEGDQRSKSDLCLTDTISEKAQGGFAAICAERMGMSKRAIYRSQTIAKNLTPEMRKAIKGTPIEDNQSELLNLAKMEPKKQKQLANGLSKNDFDLKKTIAILDGTTIKKPDAQQVLLGRLIDTFGRANPKTKEEFLAYIQKSQKNVSNAKNDLDGDEHH